MLPYKKISIQEQTALALFWVAYAFLCVYYYLPRTTYADNSYYIFNILQQESFTIEHLRYGAVLTQWMPVLAVKLHLSLQQVLLAYTANVALFYFLIFAAVRYFCDVRWVSYCFLLAMVATAHHAFFFMNSELQEGSVLLFLMVSVLRSQKITAQQRVLGLLGIGLLMTCIHLLLLQVAVMLIGLTIVVFKRKKDMLAGVCLLSCMVLKMVVFSDAYEHHALSSFDIRFFTLKNLYNSYFPQFLYRQIYFLAPGVGLLLLLLFRLSAPRRYKVFLLLGAAGLYLLLLLFLRRGSFDAYTDSYSAVLFYFMWSGVAMLITDTNFSGYFWKGAVIVVLLFSLVMLWTEERYESRIDYLRCQMQAGATKKIIPLEDAPQVFKDGSSWSVPYESLLISSVEGSSKTVLMDDHYDVGQYNRDSTLFLGASWMFGRDYPLNERYFRLKRGLYHQLQ